MAAEALRRYVKTLREGRNRSQAALASELGLPNATYNGWENGDSDARATWYLRAIAILRGDFLVLEHLSDPNVDADEGTKAAERVLQGEWQQGVAGEVEQYTAQLLARAGLLAGQGVPLAEAFRRAASQLQQSAVGGDTKEP